MAVARANVSVRVVLTGDNKASATIQQAGGDLKSLKQVADQTASALAKASAEGSTGFLNFQTRIGAATAKLGLVAQGLKSVVSGAKELGESIREGAAAGDRLDILRQDLAGVDEMIQRIQVSTAGMIPKAEITKAIAQFRQFEIPLDEMDRVLAAVAKTSVRTGEEAAFLLDSLTSGIARGSALRLDNLGILVKEEQVTRDYATAIGKTSEELTNAEKKAGLLAASLEQMERSNINVDLTNSRTASIDRLSTAVEDMWTSIKTGLADAAIGFLEFFGIIPERMTAAERSMRDMNEALDATAENLGRAAVGTLTWESEIPALIARLADLSKALGRTATAAEAATLSATVLKNQQRLTKEIALANSQLALARTNYEIINDLASKGLKTGRELNDANEELLAAGERLRNLNEERKSIGEDAVETISQEVLARKAAEEAEAAKVEELTLVVRKEEEILAAVKGITQREFRLAQIKREIGRLNEKEASDLQKIIVLMRERRGIEETIAGEKAVTQRRRGGGRRRRPEAEGLADVLELEEARLRASGQLTGEQREQLAIAKANVELDKISTALNKRKVTAQKAATDSATVEFKLAADLLSIREKEAATLEKIGEKARERFREAAEAQAEMRAALGLDELTQFEQRRADIAAAAGAGAITGEERAGLEAGVASEEEAAARAKQFELMAAGLDSVAEAGARAAASTDETLAAFGRLAEALQEHGGEIADVVNKIAVAQEKGAEAAVGATASAIAVSGKLAAAFVKDQQAKSVINGLVETALAAGSFAAQDYVGGALHTVAAALHFVAAGQAGGGAKASASAGAGARPRPAAQQPAQDGGRGFNVTINVNSPLGVVGFGNQEVATQVGEAVRANVGTGFESEAA